MRPEQTSIVGAEQTALGFDILSLRKEAADMKKIIGVVVILSLAGSLGCGEAEKAAKAAEAKAQAAVAESKAAVEEANKAAETQAQKVAEAEARATEAE